MTIAAETRRTLTPMLTTILTDHPGVDVRLVEADPAAMTRQLRDGTLDLGFASLGAGPGVGLAPAMARAAEPSRIGRRGPDRPSPTASVRFRSSGGKTPTSRWRPRRCATTRSGSSLSCAAVPPGDTWANFARIGLRSGPEHSLIASYEEAGAVTVARIGLDGRVTRITDTVASPSFDRPYAGGGFSLARNGMVAFASGRFDRPTDVAVAGSGGIRQLTHLNELTLSAKRLGTLITLDASAPDGGRVPLWILLPPNYVAGQRVPMILEIHGGPYASYGPHFSTDYQLYAAAGYAVLYTNPRGSTGYGQAFADGIEKTYPASNFDDLMAAVDAAAAAGIADPDNLFVTGGSGGGILTAWIVGKTDRFRAAASQKPVINWTSMALTSDGVPFFAPYWMGALPWENQAAYWARSPLSLMANVKTPTLVVVGSDDYRTPVSESEQFYAALKLEGVPTALVKVPEASHGGIAARPSQSAAKAAAIIAWFDKYRKR